MDIVEENGGWRGWFSCVLFFNDICKSSIPKNIANVTKDFRISDSRSYSWFYIFANIFHVFINPTRIVFMCLVF